MDERPRARVIPVAQATDDDLSAWRELAAAAAEPNPFFEPEFVVPAVAHIEQARETILVVTEDDDGWAACVPALVGRWRGVVGSVWGLRTPYTYLTTPLVRAGDEGDRFAALFTACRDVAGRRALVLERYGSDGPVGAAVEDFAAGGHAIEALQLIHERAFLRRREDADYFGWLNRKRRHELRRQKRRLDDDAGETEVLELTGDPDAASVFLAIESSGWKGREGTAMASREGHGDFFVELCNRFRSDGRLEMLALRAGENIIAMLCNLRSGEGSFSFKIAHDENYSKYSPGTQLEIANAGFFHASGSAWMDSCAEPDNAMMNRLWPERREIRTSVLTPADARGRMLQTALAGAAALRRLRRRN